MIALTASVPKERAMKLIEATSESFFFKGIRTNKYEDELR